MSPEQAGSYLNWQAWVQVRQLVSVYKEESEREEHLSSTSSLHMHIYVRVPANILGCAHIQTYMYSHHTHKLTAKTKIVNTIPTNLSESLSDSFSRNCMTVSEDEIQKK